MSSVPRGVFDVQTAPLKPAKNVSIESSMNMQLGPTEGIFGKWKLLVVDQESKCMLDQHQSSEGSARTFCSTVKLLIARCYDVMDGEFFSPGLHRLEGDHKTLRLHIANAFCLAECCKMCNRWFCVCPRAVLIGLDVFLSTVRSSGFWTISKNIECLKLFMDCRGFSVPFQSRI